MAKHNRDYKPEDIAFPDQVITEAHLVEEMERSYIEYAMVYDKLYDPLIRIVYIIAVFAVLAYLLYAYKLGAMSIFSAGVLGAIVVASIILVLKKSKESKEECLKAEKLFKNLISDIDFS